MKEEKVQIIPQWIPQWVIRNLLRYGNCIIDEQLAAKKEEIEEIIQKKLAIEKRDCFYERRGPMGTCERIQKEITYIAFIRGEK